MLYLLSLPLLPLLLCGLLSLPPSPLSHLAVHFWDVGSFRYGS